MTICQPKFTKQSNPIAYDIYKKLPKNSATCKQLTTSSGVYSFALDGYKKFQRIIEKSMQIHLPWVFDDLNSKTTFDLKIRKQVRQNILQLQKIITKQKIKNGTERYKEMMAVGLFYFVITPNAKVVGEHESHFNNETSERTRLGLNKYKEYLKVHGGLGLREEDIRNEYTAIEALECGRGDCTEISNILFATFEMAGLKPEFIYVKRTALLQSSDPRISKPVAEKPVGMDHVAIGLSLNGKLRIFDPSMRQSDANYQREHYTELTLRDYLRMVRLNKGSNYLKKNENDKALIEFERAAELSPESDQPHTNIGVAWLAKGKIEKEIKYFYKALTYFNKAIVINPGSALALINRSVVWKFLGENDKAVVDLKNAVESDPTNEMSRKLLTEAYVRQGNLAEAINTLAKLIGLGPQGHGEKTKIYDAAYWRWTQVGSRETLQAFLVDTQNANIAHLEESFVICFSLWKAGLHEKAMRIFENIVVFFEINPAFAQKRMSQSTKNLFLSMLALMPKSMKASEQTKAYLENIKTLLTENHR